jgi:hypothetical protein
MCSSFECKFAVRYVKNELGKRIAKQIKEKNIGPYAKLKCLGTKFGQWLNHPVNQSSPYEVCKWSFKAGALCQAGLSPSAMANIDAAASNGCMGYRRKEGGYLGYPAQAGATTLTMGNLNQGSSCGGKSCWAQGLEDYTDLPEPRTPAKAKPKTPPPGKSPPAKAQVPGRGG